MRSRCSLLTDTIQPDCKGPTQSHSRTVNSVRACGKKEGIHDRRLSAIPWQQAFVTDAAQKRGAQINQKSTASASPLARVHRQAGQHVQLGRGRGEEAPAPSSPTELVRRVCVNRPGEEMTGTPGVARPAQMDTRKCTGKAKPNKVGPLGHQRVFLNHAEPFLPPSCLTGPENGCMSDGVCVCGVCVESIDPFGHTWPRGTPRLLRLGTLRVRVRNAGLHTHDGNAGSLHHTHTHNQQRAATACVGRD